MPSYSLPLSLHDALPIYRLPGHVRAPAREHGVRRTREPARSRAFRAPVSRCARLRPLRGGCRAALLRAASGGRRKKTGTGDRRSEEHTSELQSLRHLVCRPTPSPFPYTTLFRSIVFPDMFALPHGSTAFDEHGSLRDPALFERLFRDVRGFVRFAEAVEPLCCAPPPAEDARKRAQEIADRKSTRLNSSHLGISYAVLLPPPFPTRRSSDLSSSRTCSRSRTGARRSTNTGACAIPRFSSACFAMCAASSASRRLSSRSVARRLRRKTQENGHRRSQIGRAHV